MKSPLVSIILVTYNSMPYIEPCLLSLKKIIYKPVELIIIDNNSTDSTIDVVKKITKRWPFPVRIIENDQNGGYAQGNNLGIESAKGSMVFVLNPDTIVSKNFLQPLVEVMVDQKRVAACQPTVYLLAKPKTLNLTGKVTHYLGFDWLKDYQSRKIPSPQSLTSFSGSGVLLKKRTFQELGGFDEKYFMYFEDSDLSWRIRLAGYDIQYVPESIVLHDYKYQPDEKYQTFKQKYYYAERNRLMTLLKNYSGKSLAIIMPIALLMELALVSYSLSKGLIIPKLNAYRDIWRSRQHIMNARKLTQSLRTTPDKQLARPFKGSITYKEFNHPVLQWFMNPLLAGYWHLVRRCL